MISALSQIVLYLKMSCWIDKGTYHVLSSTTSMNQICLLLHQDALEFRVTIIILNVMIFPPVSWLLWTFNFQWKLAGEFAKQTHEPVHYQILRFCLFFLRITRAYRVHKDFHARYQAISRTYVYRFALGLRHHTEMPVTERDLCWALRDTWVPPPLFCTCSEGFCLKPPRHARVTEAKSSQRGIGTSSGKSCTWIIHTHKQDPS